MAKSMALRAQMKYGKTMSKPKASSIVPTVKKSKSMGAMLDKKKGC